VRDYLLVMELHAHALLEMLPLGLREDPGWLRAVFLHLD
jgi:hypothetical protein